MASLVNCLSYSRKMDPSMEVRAPTVVLEKVDFFEIALINLFMNRFQNGLLIRNGHVTWQLMHHSDIYISKIS